MKRRRALLAVLAAMLAATAGAQTLPLERITLPLERITLPSGFTIELVARVPGAREMTFGANGTVFAGSPTGRVFAVSIDRSGSGERAAVVRTVASGLREPVGVAFRNGALDVSAVSRILRFDDIERRLDDPLSPVVVSDRFPQEAHHGRKFIAFGPDGKLYVPVGAPCNVCAPDPDRYASIMRMDADGSGPETFARGIRNSVGFDRDPRTGELWFTSNGRDWLGDHVPPDTLNHVPRAGEHFGFPYCHAGTIADPEFGARRPCSAFRPPAQALARTSRRWGCASTGERSSRRVTAGRNFIAEHGSWNRSRKIGYRVTTIAFDTASNVAAYEPFAEGWLQGEAAWGRPADVQVAPDGSLLIADDLAGAIYRVRYRG